VKDDYVSKRVDGVTVVLPATTVAHAVQRHEEMEKHEALAIRTLEDPDCAVDNISNFRNKRTADECFFRYEDALKAYVCLPVKTTTAVETYAGQQVPVGSKVATSYYTKPAIPSTRRKYIRSEKPKSP
jgi:hypothetical protein